MTNWFEVGFSLFLISELGNGLLLHLASKRKNEKGASEQSELAKGESIHLLLRLYVTGLIWVKVMFISVQIFLLLTGSHDMLIFTAIIFLFLIIEIAFVLEKRETSSCVAGQ